MKAILTSLLLFTPSLCLPIDDSVAQNNTTLSKRWFSVPPSPANPRTAPQISFPWPQDSSGGRPIRYCFKDRKSYDSLQALFRGPVIDMWRPALSPNSALSIVPDSRCVVSRGGLPIRFADDVAGRSGVFDALVISDITPPRSGDSSGDSTDSSSVSDDQNSRRVSKLPTPGSGSHSTIGYDPCRGDEDEPFPNTMKIMNSAYETDYEKYLLIRTMGHELGHVIGLEHEHQRPDRDQFIHVDFSKFPDYDDVLEHISQVPVQQEPRFLNLPPAQRMALVTSDPDMAEEYDFDEAIDWIKAPRTGNSEMRYYQRSQRFDYDSIMIYGSFAGAAGQRDIRDAVMIRLDRQGALREIFQGGDEDARRAGPSQLDISRVRQIYPSRSRSGQASGSGSRGSNRG